jgi:tRNA(Ile)-lysidine synthase
VLVEEVRARVRAGGLLAEGPVVVMLSGGRDSVCLLDVAVALCGAERVWALHVNYGLRPDAQADERHCRSLCEQLGVPLEVVRVGGREQETGNLHAWARELRYRAARELAGRIEASARDDRSGGLPEEGVTDEGGEDDVFDFGLTRVRARARACLASGHTSTDLVETILYRLAASPGRRALLGMAPREGRLVRPLLSVSREQTAAYCRERGVAWREDPSNDDPRFARARVRKGLVEALQEVHPAALSNVLRTAELLRAEGELLDGLVRAELGDDQSISVERLRRMPAGLQRLIVVRLAEDAAGTFVPQAGDRVAELLALADRGGRAELHVGGLVAAVVEDGALRFVEIPAREQRPPRGGQ